LSERFVVLTGCSGGGKSSLIGELRRRGFAVVGEPGRRVVREEVARGGGALPWSDMRAFLDRVVEVALEDRQAAERSEGWVFFDRSLVDAGAALENLGVDGALAALCEERRYRQQAFFAPPWREIYVGDAERRHGFDEGVAEYERLTRAYAALGYDAVPLPKTCVPARADFVLARLASGGCATPGEQEAEEHAVRERRDQDRDDGGRRDREDEATEKHG